MFVFELLIEQEIHYHATVSPNLIIPINSFDIILGVTGGVVVGQVASLQEVFGTESQWHIALSAYVILVLVCFAPFYWFPESPKYLYIARGRRELAKRGRLKDIPVFELLKMYDLFRLQNCNDCVAVMIRRSSMMNW